MVIGPRSMHLNADIIIVGGGIVGASFALQLADSGLQVAVIDQAPQSSTILEGDFDHRVYAFTPSNMARLEKLNVFEPKDRLRFTPITAMAVFGDKNSKLFFSAREAQCDELALMIEHRLLAQRLLERLRQSPQVNYFSSCRPCALEVGEQTVSLTLDDGTKLTASLVVGADGGKSWVREAAGFSVVEKDYEQIALVANFRCEKRHENIARQWFADGGILAWLPLGEAIISIVWSLPNERARELATLPQEALCHAVEVAGANSLGAMKLLSPLAQFPLLARRSERLVGERVALIGDAAHGVHPLAGQGLNLGLQDAAVLAQTLIERAAPEQVGDRALLRRYERARKEDLVRMHFVTDGLQGLFARESTFASAIRNNGLTFVNAQPWLKNMLVRHAIS
jgi:2-polyprenylphenol 6-hydroxylase